MIVQLLVAAAVVAIAASVALVLRRRRVVDAPTQGEHQAPDQLDRTDFATLADAAGPAEWLVVLFSSATCGTCADVWRKAQVLAGPDVAVVEAEYGAQQALHARYKIGAVPTLVLADRVGVVRASFLGPVTATDLWAAYAQVRDGDDPGCSAES